MPTQPVDREGPMAAEPADDPKAGRDNRLVIRDDRQATVEDGPPEKGEAVRGVPEELDGVVDAAVELMNKVWRNETDVDGEFFGDLDTILDYIDYFLGLKKSEDIPPVRDAFARPIERLVTEVENYYKETASNVDEYYDGIYEIMTSYRAKVKELIKGCLIATLQFKDQNDWHFSRFISDLYNIAEKLRHLIIGQRNLKSLVKISLAQRSDISKIEIWALLHLLEKITSRVRLELSLDKGEMLKFLMKETDEIQLTIMTRIHPLKLKDGNGFAQKFKEHERTFNAILELFNSKVLEKRHVEDKLEDVTERMLFDLFKEHGTILNVFVPKRPVAGKKNYGFVEFAEHEDACRALNGVKKQTERMTPHVSEETIDEHSETIIYIRDIAFVTVDKLWMEGDISHSFHSFQHFHSFQPFHPPHRYLNGYFPSKEGFVVPATPKEIRKEFREDRPEYPEEAGHGAGSQDPKPMLEWEDNAPDLEESKITIKELSPTTTESKLHKLCEGCGVIVEAYMTPSKDFGFVKFNTRSAAVKALKKLQSRNKLAVMATVKSDSSSSKD